MTKNLRRLALILFVILLCLILFTLYRNNQVSAAMMEVKGI